MKSGIPTIVTAALDARSKNNNSRFGKTSRRNQHAERRRTSACRKAVAMTPDALQSMLFDKLSLVPMGHDPKNPERNTVAVSATICCSAAMAQSDAVVAHVQGKAVTLQL